LPDQLLESELFGYHKGAFTDATRDKPGRFALAEGGTLFLDEIGDISPAMQVRLLRVLQERSYEPLGSVASVHTNVRIIAASNRRLVDEVAARRFRQDLFYRLNVIELSLPPLRQRPEDIPLLIDHFLDRHRLTHAQAPQGMSEAAMARLIQHSFPGNARELENIIERACVLCRGGLIEVRHLPPELAQATVPEASTAPLQAAEATCLLQALEAHNWNRLETARALGMHKTTLYRKLKRLGLKPPRSTEV
jgi:DNA-binding NtrC family response regulator